MRNQALIAPDAVVFVHDGRAQSQIRELAQQRGRVALRTASPACLLGACTEDLFFRDEREWAGVQEQRAREGGNRQANCAQCRLTKARQSSKTVTSIFAHAADPAEFRVDPQTRQRAARALEIRKERSAAPRPGSSPCCTRRNDGGRRDGKVRTGLCRGSGVDLVWRHLDKRPAYPRANTSSG